MSVRNLTGRILWGPGAGRLRDQASSAAVVQWRIVLDRSTTQAKPAIPAAGVDPGEQTMSLLSLLRHGSGPCLVLVDDDDASALRISRGGRLKRLAVCARAQRLDRALAAGARPDSSVELSLRSQMLLERSVRISVARELRNLLQRSSRSRHPFDPAVPVPRRAILENASQIEELADWLEALAPVDVRGIAQLHELLRDGGSILHRPAASWHLQQALERAAECLIPSPEIWTNT